eukprot:ctg_126.g56
MGEFEVRVSGGVKRSLRRNGCLPERSTPKSRSSTQGRSREAPRRKRCAEAGSGAQVRAQDKRPHQDFSHTNCQAVY